MAQLLNNADFIPVTMTPPIYKRPLFEVLGDMKISRQAYSLIYSHALNVEPGALSSLIPIHLNFENKNPIDDYIEHLLASHVYKLKIYAPMSGDDDTKATSLITYKQVRCEIETDIRGTHRLTGMCIAHTTHDDAPNSAQFLRRVWIPKLQ
jgi:hypothetical protein